MSSALRHAAEAMRAKYSRVFRVPIDDVRIEYISDCDARIYDDAAGSPVWTLAVGGERAGDE